MPRSSGLNGAKSLAARHAGGGSVTSKDGQARKARGGDGVFNTKSATSTVGPETERGRDRWKGGVSQLRDQEWQVEEVVVSLGVPEHEDRRLVQHRGHFHTQRAAYGGLLAIAAGRRRIAVMRNGAVPRLSEAVGHQPHCQTDKRRGYGDKPKTPQLLSESNHDMKLGLPGPLEGEDDLPDDVR